MKPKRAIACLILFLSLISSRYTNSGTTAGTNFIGTTDAVDAVLKTNNTEIMRWLYTADANNSIAVLNFGDLTVNGVSVGRGPGNVVSKQLPVTRLCLTIPPAPIIPPLAPKPNFIIPRLPI